MKSLTKVLMSTHTWAECRGYDYLAVRAFSKKGLISQLRYEGFSKEVATRGVDSLDVSWKKQAKKRAKCYLAVPGPALYEQLRYEGFTKKQSRIGVRSIGL